MMTYDDNFVKITLAGKQDINTQNVSDYHNTTLMYICNNKNVEYADIFELLVMHADVNIQNKLNYTALMYLCMQPVINQQCVELLIEHGANVNLIDNKGRTAMMLMFDNNMQYDVGVCLKLVNIFVDAGCNIDTLSTRHENILFHIVRYFNNMTNCMDITQFRGCDIENELVRQL